MSDLPYILAGWLGTGAVLSGYVLWIRVRGRRVGMNLNETRS